MKVLTWAGLRVHVLIPHDVVSTVMEGEPKGGLTLDGEGVYCHKGKPFFQVITRTGTHRTVVELKALKEIWIQEPGLTVKIEGGGEWRGIGPTGEWVKTTSGVDGWLPLHQKDAHISTVHFSRVKGNKDFAIGVVYREGNDQWKITSNFAATKLLDKPYLEVPWPGCEIFARGYNLKGTINKFEVLRRFELAAEPPDIGKVHLFNWTGGAGVVVNKQGLTPPPGEVVTEEDGYVYLWKKRSFRRMRPNESITQSVSMVKL